MTIKEFLESLSEFFGALSGVPAGSRRCSEECRADGATNNRFLTSHDVLRRKHAIELDIKDVTGSPELHRAGAPSRPDRSPSSVRGSASRVWHSRSARRHARGRRRPLSRSRPHRQQLARTAQPARAVSSTPSMPRQSHGARSTSGWSRRFSRRSQPAGALRGLLRSSRCLRHALSRSRALRPSAWGRSAHASGDLRRGLPHRRSRHRSGP